MFMLSDLKAGTRPNKYKSARQTIQRRGSKKTKKAYGRNTSALCGELAKGKSWRTGFLTLKDWCGAGVSAAGVDSEMLTGE